MKTSDASRSAAFALLPSITDNVAGNTHGPIINAMGGGSLSAAAGVNHFFANFRY